MSLIKGIKSSGDKQSTKSTGNAQAYTDTATRNNQEDRYYKLKEAKQKKGISELDFSYLKRYYSGNKTKAENAVLDESASTLRGYINAQKQKAGNANTKLNSQGNVVITQAELASMSPQAAEAFLQDSQIEVAAPGQNRVTITQEELNSMSPQMAEAMLNDPLVTLADGNGGGSNTSGQNIVTITQAELASMSSQAAEAILSDPNVQLVGSGGSGSNTSVKISGQDVIANALNDINSMSGPNSILVSQDPYRILDSAEKEASFKSAKRDKNISDDDFKWLLVLTKGDENKAKDHVIKLTASHLRSLIITQKNFAGYEDELGKSTSNGFSGGGSGSWASIKDYNEKTGKYELFKNIGETIEEEWNDFKQEWKDFADAYNDYQFGEYDFTSGVDEINEKWEDMQRLAMENTFTYYDEEEAKTWDLGKIKLLQAKQSRDIAKAEMEASLVLYNQADTDYVNAKGLNDGKWTEFLVRSSFFIGNAILFIKNVTKESLVFGFKAITKETVEELIENGLEELLNIFLKTAEKMQSDDSSIDLSIINEILNYGYGFAEILENYYILKREKKELGNLENARVAAKSIYENNLNLYNQSNKRYEKLYDEIYGG